jgi:hypothetical protein
MNRNQKAEYAVLALLYLGESVIVLGIALALLALW